MSIPKVYWSVAKLFLADVGAPDTPETEAAVVAWTLRESGGQILRNNPWNLHGVAGDYGGLAIGSEYVGIGDANVAVFGSLADGVAAAVSNLRWYAAHDASAGYGPVLAAAERGDAPGFLDALSRSKWSTGRYGGPANNDLIPLYRQALSEAAMPTKPTALTPAAEPVAYMGIVTSLILAGIQYFAGSGILTADQANQLSPQAATIANAVITILPVLLALITRQAVTPNGNVPITSPIMVTPPQSSGTTEPTAPPPTISTVTVTAFPSVVLGTIAAGTRRFEAGTPYRELSQEGPSRLAFDAKAVATNPNGHAPNGSFLRTTTTPSVLIAESAVTLVSESPVTVPFAGAFSRLYSAANAFVNNASPEQNLTANEYVVFVDGVALSLDWVGESRGWMAANVGSPIYLEQLFTRLGLLVNIYDGKGPLAGAAAVLAAIGVTQAEINRCEIIGKTDGMLPAGRNMDPATFLPALIAGEGDYVVGSPAIRTALTNAGVGIAIVGNDAWKTAGKP